MIMDKLGKLFEDRRKKNKKVEVERRKEESQVKVGTKKVNKTKK